MPTAPSLRLTNAGARSMLEAAIAEASEFGITATVAIVDAGGHMIVLERMDGGRFHTVHSSTTKAVTAASNRRPTTTKGAQGQDLDYSRFLYLIRLFCNGKITRIQRGI